MNRVGTELQAIHTVHIPWPLQSRIFPAQAKHIPSKGECVKVIGQAYADRPTASIDRSETHQHLHSV